MTIKSLLRVYIVFIIITALSVTYFFGMYPYLNNRNIFLLATFFIIGLLSLYNIISSINLEASIYKVHGYFFFIFMFLAPLHQYVIGKFPWGFMPDSQVLLLTNLILIIWLSVVIVTYKFVKSSSGVSRSLPTNQGFIYLGFVLALFSTILTINDVGGLSELFRRNFELHNTETTSHLIFSKAIRPFPAIFLAYLIIIRKSRKVVPLFSLIFLFSLILFIITNFPTGIARYQTAAVYLGLLIIIFKDKIKFDYLFLLGILIIFPMLNNFRYGEFNITDMLTFEAVNYTTGHFDAYSMLARTLIYVGEFNPTYGHQLLGVLFFFIPRSVWPSKPLGSGYEVGMSQGLDFLNISSPIVAEAVINFGLIVFIVFPILIAYLIKKLDTLYWKNANGYKFVNLYYVFLIGFSFFLFRGDLLSAFSYIIAFNTPILFLYFIALLRLKK